MVDDIPPPQGTEPVSHEVNRLGGARMRYSDVLAGRTPPGDVEAQSNGERKPLLQKKQKVKSKQRGGGAQMRRSTTNESVSFERILSSPQSASLTSCFAARRVQLLPLETVTCPAPRHRPPNLALFRHVQTPEPTRVCRTRWIQQPRSIDQYARRLLHDLREASHGRDSERVHDSSQA